VQSTAGVYIHIPFCHRKCTYCNFNTTDFFEDLAARYVSAVSREISFWGESLAAKSDRKIAVDTVYFGGGTPSILEAEQIAKLADSCRSAFEVSSDAEVTIEINPATLSREKLRGWLDAGINRASVGVQSFIDRELVSLSRTHNSGEAHRTFDTLREAGFKNISLDLIAGLPEQSLEDWTFNLSQALSLTPEHLSLYMLDLKEGTQLYAQLKRGLRPVPDEDLAAEMYRLISEMTRLAGYEHYEISNFARFECNEQSPSPFRSRHNLKYWTGESYYGVGCGAHSYDGKSRWSNVLKTETYIEQVGVEGSAIAERRELDETDRAVEALFMGLRLREGVDLVAFQSAYGVDILDRYHQDLPRLTEAGLIEVVAGRLALTPAGRLLSNEVFVSFV
jgi:oxygen-independent coproporphyrinogen III oxidase